MEKSLTLISEEARKKIEGYYVDEEEIIYNDDGKRIGRVKRTRFIESNPEYLMQLYKKHKLI